MTKEVIARQVEPVMGQDAWHITDKEIVRCRDCKYSRMTGLFMLQCLQFTPTDIDVEDDCKLAGMIVHSNGFCVWGERRDEEATA